MQFSRWPGSLVLAAATLALCVTPAWLGAQEPAPVEPAQQIEQVKQSFEDKQAELWKKYGALEDEAEQAKVYAEIQALVKQALKDARAIAESAPGTETAATGWSFVLSYAPRANNMELAGVAFDHLLEEHLASPAWKDLAPMLRDLPGMGMDEEKVVLAMRALMAESPFKAVQASAMFSLGIHLAEQTDSARHEEGLALVRRVAKDFADVKEAKDSVKAAEGTLFQLEKLQLGMPCPDFVASDETGAKFKLSDYKGKVVLIDFWGYW